MSIYEYVCVHMFVLQDVHHSISYRVNSQPMAQAQCMANRSCTYGDVCAIVEVSMMLKTHILWDFVIPD